MDTLSIVIFDKPSGEVRGLVNAFAMVKGKRKRIAHATLLVDKQPDIALELPRNVGVGDIAMLAGILNEFAVRVTELEAS